MGRYVAVGVVSRIDIFRKNNFNLEKNKEKILTDLGKYLDLSKYDMESYKNCLSFYLKKEHFNNNIHDLIKEMAPIIKSDALLYNCGEDIEIETADFNKQNVPIIIKRYEKGNKEGEFYCECKEDSENEEIAYEFPEYWIFNDEDLSDELEVKFAYICLWRDWDKFGSEDETNLLKILNTLRYPYFKNELSKNILFYISG